MAEPKETPREKRASNQADRADSQADRADYRADRADSRADYADVQTAGLTEFLNRLFSLMRLIGFLVIVVIVMLAGNLLQGELENDRLDKLAADIDVVEKASDDARSSAARTQDVIEQAIADLKENSNDQPPLNNQAVIDALEAVNRIERFLCGDICGE